MLLGLIDSLTGIDWFGLIVSVIAIMVTFVIKCYYDTVQNPSFSEPQKPHQRFEIPPFREDTSSDRSLSNQRRCSMCYQLPDIPGNRRCYQHDRNDCQYNIHPGEHHTMRENICPAVASAKQGMPSELAGVLLGNYGLPTGCPGASLGNYGMPTGYPGISPGNYGMPTGCPGISPGNYGMPTGCPGISPGNYGIPNGFLGISPGNYGMPPVNPGFSPHYQRTSDFFNDQRSTRVHQENTKDDRRIPGRNPRMSQPLPEISSKFPGTSGTCRQCMGTPEMCPEMREYFDRREGDRHCRENQDFAVPSHGESPRNQESSSSSEDEEETFTGHIGNHNYECIQREKRGIYTENPGIYNKNTQGMFRETPWKVPNATMYPELDHDRTDYEEISRGTPCKIWNGRMSSEKTRERRDCEGMSRRTHGKFPKETLSSELEQDMRDYDISRGSCWKVWNGRRSSEELNEKRYDMGMNRGNYGISKGDQEIPGECPGQEGREGSGQSKKCRGVFNRMFRRNQ